jgi:hypothetical protein
MRALFMKKNWVRYFSTSTSIVLSVALSTPATYARDEVKKANFYKNKSMVNPTLCKMSDTDIESLNTGLLQLGFGSYNEGSKKWEDHAKIMSEYLEQKKYYNNDISDQDNMNKLQLMRNIIAYDAVQGAKEIVLEMMRLTGGCFTAKLEKFSNNILPVFLSFKPWSLPTHPKTKMLFENDGVFAKDNLKKFEETNSEEAADEALKKQLQVLMDEQARGITNHFVKLTRDLSRADYEAATPDIKNSEEELAKLFYPNVAKLIRLAYLDHQIGRTSWLARAFLAASEIIAAKEGVVGGVNVKDRFEEKLKTKMASAEDSKNFHLENILGTTWKLPNEQLSLKASIGYAKAQLEGAKNKVVKFIDSLTQVSNDFYVSTKGNPLKDIPTPKLPKASEYAINPSPYETHDVDVPIADMSYVLTRNVAIEGAVIPSGAIPPESLMAEAKAKNLIGNYIGAINYIDAETAENYDVITETRDKAFYRTLNDGYSHIGYAHLRSIEVPDKKGESTRTITMSWVIDNYPSPAADAETPIKGPYNSAGIRFIGLEQYYKVSAHTQLMVATPDASKFEQFAQNQVLNMTEESLKTANETSNLSEVYLAHKPKLSANGKPETTKDTTQTYWPMEVSFDDFQKIHASIHRKKYVSSKNYLLQPNTQNWFKSVTTAATNKLTEFMYKGMTFVWITPNGQYYHGAAYCSFTGLLAYKLGAGIDVQVEPDTWDSLVGKIKSFYDLAVKKATDCKQENDTGFLCEKMASIAESPDVINIKKLSTMPIVAPSGLPAQIFIPLENITRVEAPFIPIQDRLEAGFKDAEKRVAKQTANVKAGIDLIIAESKINPSIVDRYPLPQLPELNGKMVENIGSIDFYEMHLDPAELRGLTMDLVESSISKLGCGDGSLSLVCGK